MAQYRKTALLTSGVLFPSPGLPILLEFNNHLRCVIILTVTLNISSRPCLSEEPALSGRPPSRTHLTAARTGPSSRHRNTTSPPIITYWLVNEFTAYMATRWNDTFQMKETWWAKPGEITAFPLLNALRHNSDHADSSFCTLNVKVT